MPFPIKIPAKLVIMSHLSDAQELATKSVWHDINFAKFLLIKYSNTDANIDADKEYALYLKSQKKDKQ